MKTHSASRPSSHAWNRSALPFLVLLGLLLQPAPGRADGVTIITHGYNPSVATTPLWMASMRDAISTNYLNGAQNYGTITVTGSAGNLVATCSPWNVGLSGGTNGDILIVLDWSAVADSLTTGVTAQSVAAVVVNDIVTGQNGQRPLAELPIHLIGHSRGGGLVCELARLLGNDGVVVDQLTPLDPHPLTASDPQPPLGPAVIDTPAAIYQNVVFADVYSQTNTYPMGEYLSGGYNRMWASLIGGYNNNSAPYNTYAEHRNVLLLYQGTITLTNPVYNNEATMGVTERAAWYNTYEAAGTNTGFTYSRLEGSGVRTSANTPVAGGDEIVAGLNNASVFGGGGARSSLAWSSAVWPNVAQLQVVSNGTALGSGAYQIPIGTTLQLPYVYLDYSNGCTVTLHVDTDRNPYNGNDVAIISTNVCAATGATYTQGTINWNTTGISPQAAVYVYAEVTDGTHTRYFYAAPQLALVQPPPAVAITSTVTSVPGTQGTIVISGTNNAYVTGLMCYTNTATGAWGTFSAQPAWSTPAITLAYGTNVVTVTGTNSAGAVASAGIAISRGAPSVMYVAANGANVWPYDTWAGAATTIQTAVNAVPTGGTVLVSNGVYAAGGAFSASPAISNRVVISQAITVQSVNGPAVTFIVGAPDPQTGRLGANATRCVCISAGLLAGFTLTNGYTRADSDWNYQEGGGGALVTGGVISNCVATGCFASHFGGGVDLFGGDAWNCVIVGNTAYDGGGLKVQGDNAVNCLICNNYASDSGAGAYFWEGGTLDNCTVAGNTATNQGGGVYCYLGGTNLNTIVFSNTVAGSVSNYTTNGGGVFQYCCTTPNPGGTGNIIGNPLFVNAAAGNYRLYAGSPCINAGNNAYAQGATDLDGNPRNTAGTVDMGAYEFVFSAVTYVSTNGANLPPFNTWTNAATTIQAAVETVLSGGTVWVSNGVYAAGGAVAPRAATTHATTNRVCITSAITVQSLNGPSNTFIVGAAPLGPAAVRCLYMSAGVLSGFTLTNGYTMESGGWPDDSGAGAYLDSGGTLSNCVLTGCSAYDGAGGVICNSGGTVNNCTISGNTSGSGDGDGGGGVYCIYAGGTLNNCAISGNKSKNSSEAAGSGGGVYCLYGGTLNNCTFTSNSATIGGGVNCVSGGTLNNCLLYGNSASGGGAVGGGACFDSGGTLNNCTISTNSASAAGGGNGVYTYSGGTLNNCIVFGNSDDDIDGSGLTNQYTCSPGLSGSGCITNNPLFVNAAAGNYQLAAGSPCINAGNNAYVQGATDLAGNPRIIGGVVDMGACESTNGATANGIPWGWLMQYGLATDGSADLVDSDGTGFNTLQDYTAGINPTNSASYFHINSVSNLPPLTVYFQSSSGRLYTLYSRTNVAAGSWLPVPGQTNVPGTGGPLTLCDTNTSPSGRFYRISVQLP